MVPRRHEQAEDDSEPLRDAEADTALDVVLDVGAVVANLIPALGMAVPGLGGALATVLGGWGVGRRRHRIVDVMDQVRVRLGDLEGDVREIHREYVRSEDFEELLTQTLRRAADERNAEKRRIYGQYLAGLILSPGAPYDEELRVLRTIEELQPDHFRVLRAVNQPPDENTNMHMGARIQVLRKRLPNMSEERIQDLVGDLNDAKVTKLSSLSTTMTARGAEDMRSGVTGVGSRFLRYLES